MMFSIALEEKRREAGQYPIYAPVSIQSITPRDKKSIWELSFDVSHTKFSFEGLPAMPMAGDVLGIYPKNSPEDIATLKRNLLGLEDEKVFLKGRYEADSGEYYATEEALAHVSLNPVRIELLEEIASRLDILEEIPSQWHWGYEQLQVSLAHLRETAPDPKEWLKHVHAGDILEAFPGLLTLQELCDIQGGIYRRVYTLAGIDRNEIGDPLALSILMATGVSYQTPANSFGQGKIRTGIASSYLQRILSREAVSSIVEVFVQRRKFGAPEKHRSYLPHLAATPDPEFLAKLKMPLLLVGAGSGISGICAILQERMAWHQKGYSVGTASLLFGLHNRHTDYLCEEELDYFLRKGLLDRIELAESRPLNGNKRYVQHLIMEGYVNRELEEVKQAQRSLVLCGDWKMGQGVLQGCLPFIFAEGRELDLTGSLFDLPIEIIESLFLKGQKKVFELKVDGIIRASASGSRYTKTELTCEDALEGLRKIGLKEWQIQEQDSSKAVPTSV